MTLQKLFPSTISIQWLEKNSRARQKRNAELVKECYQIETMDHEGKKWSRKNYPGGFTSYATLSHLDQLSSSFLEVKKLIDPQVKAFAQHLQMDLRGRKLVMTSFWLNIMPAGVVHTMHIHPLSTVSGTYYVQTPKKGSGLKFEDPRLVNFMASPPRKPTARPENQRFISVQPQAGQVILFESWMRHEVPPHTSSQDRISVSFNYDWI
jgi:uncharacterized protein (TIGR02466 family)